jgi:predicted RNase H-like nuclease
VSQHVVGLDGCRGGWLVCRFDIAAQRIDLLAVATSFARVLENEKAASCIAVDISIGLPEPGAARRCDVEARRLLTRVRASSVFPAPSRLFLRDPYHACSSARSKEICGKGISAQAYAIFPKVAEVDELITPAMQDRVFEVHPEVCFWRLSGAPMQHSKKTLAGFEERRNVLASAFPCSLPERHEVRRLGLPIGPDDLLDAVAAAVTASRASLGKAERLPPVPELDVRKLRMEMLY